MHTVTYSLKPGRSLSRNRIEVGQKWATSPYSPYAVTIDSVENNVVTYSWKVSGVRIKNSKSILDFQSTYNLVLHTQGEEDA